MRKAISNDDAATMVAIMKRDGYTANSVMHGESLSHYTPLTMCVSLQARKCFDHLIARDGNPAVYPKTGESALVYAVKHSGKGMHYVRRIMQCRDIAFMPYQRNTAYPRHLPSESARELIDLTANHPNFNEDIDMTEFVSEIVKMCPAMAIHACNTFKHDPVKVMGCAIRQRHSMLMEHLLEHSDVDLTAYKELALEVCSHNCLVEFLRRDPKVTDKMVDMIIDRMMDWNNNASRIKCLDTLLTLGARPTRLPVDLSFEGRMQYNGENWYKYACTLHRHKVPIDEAKFTQAVCNLSEYTGESLMNVVHRYIFAINKDIPITPALALHLVKNAKTEVERRDYIADLYLSRIEHAPTFDKKREALLMAMSTAASLKGTTALQDAETRQREARRRF